MRNFFMLKKIFFIINVLVLTSVYGKTEYCPSVADIRSGTIHGWNYLNANSNAIAKKVSVEKFIRDIQHFDQAEYFEDGSFNAHCYYKGFEEVYLAKKLPELELTNVNWKRHFERWHCQSTSTSHCFFG